VANPSLETVAAGDFGGIARRKNTQRLWVPPNDIAQAAVTGTWVLENAAIASTMALTTADAGSTNVFQIAFRGPFSDLAVQSGSGIVDRGARVIGIVVPYTVTNSNLAAVTLKIYQGSFTTAGLISTAEITSTTSFATEATGLTQTTHLAKAIISASNRVFVQSGAPCYAQLTMDDGTASDVWIYGACWHYEVVED
jgi:hypothetical protein